MEGTPLIAPGKAELYCCSWQYGLQIRRVPARGRECAGGAEIDPETRLFHPHILLPHVLLELLGPEQSQQRLCLRCVG